MIGEQTIFVSFHMNSFVDSSVTGTEVFIYEKEARQKSWQVL